MSDVDKHSIFQDILYPTERCSTSRKPKSCRCKQAHVPNFIWEQPFCQCLACVRVSCAFRARTNSKRNLHQTTFAFGERARFGHGSAELRICLPDLWILLGDSPRKRR